MRSPCLALFLLLSPIPSLCQTPPPSAANSPTTTQFANVGGSVFRLDTGQPLKKAVVTLESRSDAQKSCYDITDEQGHFSMGKVDPGSYRLVVSRNGYVDAEYGQRRIGGSGAVLTLSSGQHMSDLVFKLARTAALGGHVYDEDGEPVRGASVTVFRAGFGQGKSVQINNQPSVTNDLGEFRVFDLAPGRYFVSVFYHPGHDFDSLVRFGKPQSRQGYLPSFYPSTTDAAKAQALVIHAGDDVRSLDFFLRQALLVSVSGKVVLGIPNVTNTSINVFLYPRDSGSVETVNLDAVADPKTGTFQIENVPPGSYYIGCSYFDRESGTRSYTRRDLDVGNFNADGITLALLPGIDISGRVLWEGPPPAGLAGLHIRLDSLDKKQMGTPTQTVKSDGSFVLKNISEGEYRIAVAFGATTRLGYLQSARYGTTSLTDGVITVHPGSDASLELTLSARTAQVSGTVLTSDPLPAVGVQVILIPDEPHRDNRRKFRSETTDQNGKFTITGIEPGDYKLFSWDIADEDEEPWVEADWLKPFEVSGTSIHLGESDTKTLQLNLINLPKDANPQ
jgi:hypothetical protein